MRFLKFTPIVLLVFVMGCDRFIERNGAKSAPGARGPAMEGVVNPAGLKVPASAVSGNPSPGYWNCDEGFDGYHRKNPFQLGWSQGRDARF